MSFVPLALVTRGDTVESVHYGAVAVVDRAGQVIASAGDPERVLYTRSACKPFQAMPFVARGGHVRFGLTTEEVAVICASHSGEAVHEAAVRSILKKAGRGESDLLCGSHIPHAMRTGEKQVVGKADLSPVLNNCSGKHAGMLAFCELMGVSCENYIDFEHPIQREIRTAVSDVTDVPEAQIEMGIDGCSAPNFALPLSGLARAFGRLTRSDDDATYGEAPGIIYDAMTSHPHMVSGTGRGDLAIMETGAGDWVSKVGGEAIKGIGVRSAGLGIAVKIADGNTRALVPVVVEILRQLGLLKRVEGTALADWVRPDVRNHRDIVIGRIEPDFQLTTVASGVLAGGTDYAA